jgi:hypothetical protein
MVLAHEKRALAFQSALKEVPACSLREVAAEIESMRVQAIYASTATMANNLYRSAVSTAKLAMRCVPPGASPLDYVELCNIVADCQCVLNRADDALWHAKVACAILDSFEPAPLDHEDRERHEFASVNMLRQQGVAYFNLAQYRDSLRLYAQAEASEPMKRRDDARKGLKGLIMRDKIKTLARLPRFSITEAENTADELRGIIEKTAGANRRMGLWLLAEAVADAYIRHENYKDARRVLEQEYLHSDDTHAIGPLHRVLFLRTYATLSRLTHDTLGWRHFIGEAHQISLAAGLSHQLVEIEAEMRER